MKQILILLALALVAPTFAQRKVTVRGYYTKKGKWVAPHERTVPDHNFSNNWSSRGNRNPLTGKTGTEVRPPRRHIVRGPALKSPPSFSKALKLRKPRAPKF